MKFQLLLILFALGLGNFLFAFVVPDLGYLVATERTLFQGIALLVVWILVDKLELKEL